MKWKCQSSRLPKSESAGISEKHEADQLTKVVLCLGRIRQDGRTTDGANSALALEFRGGCRRGQFVLGRGMFVHLLA